MTDLQYCDLNVMSSNRILVNVYNYGFVGRYIADDFNDQILHGPSSLGRNILNSFPLFGFVFNGMRSFDYTPGYVFYDYRVKKIVYNP